MTDDNGELRDQHDTALRRISGAPWWMVAVLLAAMALVIVGYTVQYREMHSTLTAVEDSVGRELAQKDKEIGRLNETVADLQFVLNEQAVPAIVAMGEQIVTLGGDPPEVILDATERPGG